MYSRNYSTSQMNMRSPHMGMQQMGMKPINPGFKSNFYMVGNQMHFRPTFSFTDDITKFIKNSFLGTDIGFLLTFALIGTFITLGFILSYENADMIQYSFSNNIVAVVGALVALYLLFHYMGEITSLFEIKVDIGYLIYVFILCVLIFVFSS